MEYSIEKEEIKKESKMNIYIGNLSHDVTDEDLRDAFESFGRISSAHVIKDKFSGDSRGFGFVEMPDKIEAQNAISSLNDKELKGRQMKVNEARPRSEGRRGGGRSGGGRSGGGRSGGGSRRGGRYSF